MESVSRVPQGTCGLKSAYWFLHFRPRQSGPARDLWIEILLPIYSTLGTDRRVPQGTCGLKCCRAGVNSGGVQSGPARDLWIEIEESTYWR